MTISLVSNVTANGLNGATSSSINTSGANFLLIAVAYDGSITVSDSKSNTWTALTEQGAAGKLRLYYVANATVGSGHTFTVSGTGVAANFSASAWAGVKTTSPAEQEEGATSVGSVSVASIGPLDITPSENNAIVVCAVAINGSVSSLSASNGFTLLDHVNFSSGNYYGVAISYVIQTTAAAVDHNVAQISWTTAQVTNEAGVAFLPAPGGPGGAALSGSALTPGLGTAPPGTSIGL